MVSQIYIGPGGNVKIFSQLFRYASRNFITSFLVAFTCLFSIILLFDFAEIERRTSAKEISFFMKLNMIFLRAPHFAEQVLPFIVFIAAIFVFWRMNRSNELIIFRSSGISLWRLILPISLTALLIGFVDLTAFNPLSVAMQQRYDKLVRSIDATDSEDIKVSSTGLWLSEQSGPNQAIYRADKINLRKHELLNVNIVIISPQDEFLQRVDAEKATLKDNELLLENGWYLEKGKPSEKFTEKVIPTNLNQSKIKRLKTSRGFYSFKELPSYIKLLQSSGLNSRKYEMFWHSMLASAFWVGAMVVLAAAFSCRPYRQGKTLLLLLLGVLIGFALYFFKDMTFAMGAAGFLPTVISAWLPPVITVMVGAVAVFYQEDG